MLKIHMPKRRPSLSTVEPKKVVRGPDSSTDSDFEPESSEAAKDSYHYLSSAETSSASTLFTIYSSDFDWASSSATIPIRRNTARQDNSQRSSETKST